MDEIKLVFQYTEAEYVRATRLYWIHSPFSIRTSLVLAGVLALFMLACMLYFTGTFMFVVLFAVACVLFLLLWWIYWFMPGRIFRAALKFQDEYYLAFTAEGIHWKTASVDSQLKWGIYTKCWETREFFYLIQAKNVYTVIPKRAFIDAAQIQAFRDMCAQAGLGR